MNSGMLKICKPSSQTIVDNCKKTLEKHKSKQASKPKLAMVSHADFSAENGVGAISTLMNAMVEGMFVVSISGHIKMINPAAAKLFGGKVEQLQGQLWFEYLNENFREEYRSLFSHLQGNAESLIAHGPKEVLLNQVNGTLLAADLSFSGVTTNAPESEPLYIGVLHDLTSHKAEYGKLKRLARTDHLTGLANRFAFEESLNESWNDCILNDAPISLLLIDVDYFKQFNDQHGHVNGDKCLQRISNIIANSLPSRACVAARYGGEEFAVIIPRCNFQIAEIVAQRIQNLINDLSFIDLGLPSDVSVTVSQGIACEQKNAYSTPEALVSSADAAMYEAKANGRDCINLR